MNYWWVSQNQTHKQEIGGGYMWSPKADKNGKPVQSYTNMTKVSVGDLVFAFYQSKIQSIGTVLHPAVTSPKPEEFGSSGDYWSNSGWMVAVSWTALPNPMSPKEHIETLIPFSASETLTNQRRWYRQPSLSFCYGRTIRRKGFVHYWV